MKIFWIDLFSGAGGTTTGIHLVDDSGNVQVVACVNHDKVAIESHKANHPECLHFVEDVRDFNVVLSLKILVEKLRKEHPECLINIWASLECTNYSKAKGGLPRDADSRTLANALFMYLEELNPDYLFIENVREFMAWGPLDENGRPISRMNGTDYIKWVNTVKSYGYNFDYKLLNAADFGAYTSRERYFGQFAAKGNPINWPEPTHTKNPSTGKMFAAQKKWKAVREVLDLKDEGESIFTRKIPLSENTLKRIHAGLVKFVAGGEDLFIKKYYSGRPAGKVISANSPAGSITTIDGHAPVFIKRYNGGNPKEKVKSIDQPIGAITTQNRYAIVSPEFLAAYYSTGKNVHSIEAPCPVVSTKDRFNKVKPVFFIDQQFGNSKPKGIDEPVGTLTVNPKYNLVDVKPWIMDTNFKNIGNSIDEPGKVITASRKHHYLMNPSWGGNNHSIDKPSPVVVARQDKAPLYIIGVDTGNYGIIVYENDTEFMVKIKEFMSMYGIIDIKMRMLKIPELLKIQGFPEGYKLKGTKTDQKKFIGNAVVPLIAKEIAQANYNGFASMLNQKAS